MLPKRVCVIGSGASGLVSIKEAKSNGFDIVCYERSGWTGGLWRFHEEDIDGLPSVTKSTIINSSKEVSAFSDFPPPKEMPNYCHHSDLVAYFDAYTEKHDLTKYIKLRHLVKRVTQSSDYDSTGKWDVTAENLDTNQEETSTFDAVMVCTGHHVKPHVPTFKGQDKFQGKIIHTHSYKTARNFYDQKVAVIGIGNSGGDAAVELSAVTNKTYLSFRTGQWTVYRLGKDGLPLDDESLSRINALAQRYFPALVNTYGEKLCNEKFSHSLYGLQPNHRLLSQHPFSNDALPNRILSGTVKLRRNVEEFTEKGIIFQNDGGKETELDSVILATGYEMSFPFLDKSILNTDNNQVSLFKYVFCPQLKHPETLAIIGCIQPYGPLIPISEIQARWMMELLCKRRNLPSREVMVKDIQHKREKMKNRFYGGLRHTVQVDYTPFMAEIAKQGGFEPNLKEIFFEDPKLWFVMMTRACYPYQWRIRGHGKWSGARSAIMGAQDRIHGAFMGQQKMDLSPEGFAVDFIVSLKGYFKILFYMFVLHTLLNMFLGFIF